MYYNPFAQESDDSGKKTRSRIGKRIRAIREENNMTQGELGEAVGLNANRIQQYENGARNPKAGLRRKIAEALGVDENALSDPQVACYIGAMYTFFEMEGFYDLRLIKIDGQICIFFGESQNDIRVNEINRNLMLWYDRRAKMEEDIRHAASEAEKKKIIQKYNMWEYNFPYSSEQDGDPAELILSTTGKAPI